MQLNLAHHHLNKLKVKQSELFTGAYIFWGIIDTQVFGKIDCIKDLNCLFSEIVECAGGSWLKQMPKKKSDDIIIISCPEDKNLLKKAINAGFNVQDKEFLLTGLLKQDLNFESHVQNIL